MSPLQRGTQKRNDEIQSVTKVLWQLGNLVGAVNKIGSNFNQFAKEVNMGRPPRLNSFQLEWLEFREMFDRDMAELRHCCLQALGQEPHRGSKEDEEFDDD